MNPKPGQVMIGTFGGRAYLMRVSSKEMSDTLWSLPEGTIYTQLIEHCEFDNESQIHMIIDQWCDEWNLPVTERLDAFTWLLTEDPVLKRA